MGIQDGENPLLHFPTYCEKFLKIISNGHLQPLRLNIYQRKLAEEIEAQRREGRPVRILVLKARQVGLSTLCCAYNYFQTATNFYQKSALIAHDSDSTGNLFNIVKRYYDLSPDAIKPMKRYSNRRELVFENPDEDMRSTLPGLMSSIEVNTAGSSTAGRSSTINNLHISELSFWPNASETLTSLMQALSSDKNSSCIIESTANGFDGVGKEFYERCRLSQEGLSDFKFFFVPWHAVSHYVMDLPVIDPTDKELKLKERFSLSDNQLAWRRWKIINDFGGDEHSFLQEYPSFPEEAFIHSGRPVFDNEALFDLIGRLEGERYEVNGNFKIYDKPKPEEVYVIGADIAEGVEDGDFSTAFVLDRNFNQVASCHMHIAPDIFGHELIKLARLYNSALIAPEYNNHGIATIIAIKNAGYTNIYQREAFDKHEIDINQRLGWHTNVKTKQLMLDEFKAAVRDNALSIMDVDLVREMTRLFYEADGNVILTGKDRVVAACIALQALKQAPSKLKFKAVLMDDEEYLEKSESFLDRQRRLAKKANSYFK